MFYLNSEYEINQYKIKNKICSLTIDNGRDINLAANLGSFGTRINCMAHNINLVVKNSLNLHNAKMVKKVSL